MTKSRQRFLVISGGLLVLAAPLILTGTGVFTYFQPRLFRSYGIFELLHSAEDTPKLRAAFEAAKEGHRARLERPVPARTSLTPTGQAGQFQVTVLDLSPQSASDSAVTLMMLMNDAFPSSRDDEPRRIRVLAKPEVALRPAYPNVPKLMTLALMGALFSGGCGGTLLIVGLVSRSPNKARNGHIGDA